MDFRNQVVTANRKSRRGAVRGLNTRNVPLGEFEGGRHVGKKRGRDEDEDAEDMEEEEARGAETTDGQTMVGKRRAYAEGQNNVGKASGRSWKVPTYPSPFPARLGLGPRLEPVPATTLDGSASCTFARTRFVGGKEHTHHGTETAAAAGQRGSSEARVPQQ